MSNSYTAQNTGNSGKITLPRLGPINERRAPVKLSRDGWTATHASASVPPEVALPRSARDQNNNATAHNVHLPPIADLIAEVDARVNAQQRTIRISRTLLPGPARRIVIECQSLLSRGLPGFPLYEIRNWDTIRPAFNLLNGITEYEVQRRLASVPPPVIGFYVSLNVNDLHFLLF